MDDGDSFGDFESAVIEQRHISLGTYYELLKHLRSWQKFIKLSLETNLKPQASDCLFSQSDP